MLVREAKVNNSPSANSLSKVAVKRVHNLHAPNKTRRRLLDKDKKDKFKWNLQTLFENILQNKKI